MKEPNEFLHNNKQSSCHSNLLVVVIHNIFAVIGITDNPGDSLFTYGPNGDWESFYDVEYLPAFQPTFSSPELEQEAHLVCGDDQLCIFDVAATGNLDVGSSTKQSVQDQETLKALFVQS